MSVLQRYLTQPCLLSFCFTITSVNVQLEVKLRNEQLIEKAAESTSAWQAKFGATLLKAKARLERSKWAVKEKQAEAASAEHATKAHTHTQTHMTRARTNTYAYTHVHIRIRIRIARTRARTHAHTHARTLHTHMPAHTNARASL